MPFRFPKMIRLVRCHSQNLARGERVRSQLCEAPVGPFRQLTPAPFTIPIPKLDCDKALDPYAEPERTTRTHQNHRKIRCNLPTLAAEEPICKGSIDWAIALPKRGIRTSCCRSPREDFPGIREAAAFAKSQLTNQNQHNSISSQSMRSFEARRPNPQRWSPTTVHPRCGHWQVAVKPKRPRLGGTKSWPLRGA
jgi:hypothetical protein